MKNMLAMLLLLCAVGCNESSKTTAPIPPASPDYLCRCHGKYLHVALLRIESEPTALRIAEGEPGLVGLNGAEFDATLVSGLPSSSSSVRNEYPLPAAGTRMHIWQLIRGADGTLLRGLTAGSPQTMTLHQGMSVLVELGGANSSGAWPVTLLPCDPANGALTRSWYRFPPGTPASQVLDPTEWNNPVRGCDGVCVRLPSGDWGDPDASGLVDATSDGGAS